MKMSIIILAMGLSLGAHAEQMSCNFISSHSEFYNDFLIRTTAQFNCNGNITRFVGDNIYVSCKPQFVLADFTKSLSAGELVEFTVHNYGVSGIDGSHGEATMVNRAVSASGLYLEPQTIIQQGKPVKCDPTQIVVR